MWCQCGLIHLKHITSERQAGDERLKYSIDALRTCWHCGLPYCFCCTCYDIFQTVVVLIIIIGNSSSIIIVS